jgi:internalin A
LEKVTILHLDYKQLTEVPKGLEKLTQLERLNLDGNQLTHVKGLEKLAKLTYLNLGDNQLTDVSILAGLTNLKKLYLADNSDLPKAQLYELKKAMPKCVIIHPVLNH